MIEGLAAISVIFTLIIVATIPALILIDIIRK